MDARGAADGGGGGGRPLLVVDLFFLSELENGQG